MYYIVNTLSYVLFVVSAGFTANFMSKLGYNAWVSVAMVVVALALESAKVVFVVHFVRTRFISSLLFALVLLSVSLFVSYITIDYNNAQSESLLSFASHADQRAFLSRQLDYLKQKINEIDTQIASLPGDYVSRRALLANQRDEIANQSFSVEQKLVDLIDDKTTSAGLFSNPAKFLNMSEAQLKGLLFLLYAVLIDAVAIALLFVADDLSSNIPHPKSKDDDVLIYEKNTESSKNQAFFIEENKFVIQKIVQEYIEQAYQPDAMLGLRKIKMSRPSWNMATHLLLSAGMIEKSEQGFKPKLSKDEMLKKVQYVN